MKSRLVILMLILLLATVAMAQGPSPSTGNRQDQKTTNQQARTQQPPTPTGINFPLTTSPAQLTPSTQRDETANNPQSWNDWFWQNVASLLLVLVGIWAAGIAFRTLDRIAQQAKDGTIAANAAMESANVARQDLEIGNRAYLYLSEVRITFYEAQNIFGNIVTYRYEIVYPIYNGGQTPALYLSSLARSTVDDVAPRQISEAAAALDKEQSAVVRPRSREPLRPIYPSFVDKSELDDIKAGKRKLFFYGMLAYRDIFDKERHTRFTLSFSGTPAKEGEFRLMAFESGKDLNWFD